MLLHPEECLLCISPAFSPIATVLHAVQQACNQTDEAADLPIPSHAAAGRRTQQQW